MLNSLHALSVKYLFSSDYLKMKDAVQQYAEKYAAKSYDNGRTEGISIAVKALLNLVSKGIITLDSAIIESGLNKEEFYSIAETLCYKFYKN